MEICYILLLAQKKYLSHSFILPFQCYYEIFFPLGQREGHLHVPLHHLHPLIVENK